MADTEFKLTAEFVKEWNRIRAKVDGMGGDGINNTPSSLHHNQPGEVQHADKDHSQLVKLLLTGSAGGSGRFNAKIVYGGTNNEPSNLQASDIGTTSTQTVEVWDISQVGQYVMGVLGGFNKTNGIPIYLTASGAGFTLIYVTSNTGVAIYQGTTVVGVGSATDINGTGMSATGSTCIFKNLCEIGSTAASPFLDNGTYFIGFFIGTDEATNLPMYWGSQVEGLVCS